MEVKKVKTPEKGYEHKAPVKQGRRIFLHVGHLLEDRTNPFSPKIVLIFGNYIYSLQKVT